MPTTSAPSPPAARGGTTRAARLWVRLAVALAFADASIVVLALPQIVDRLHTSISHVVWVIVAYNLALIAGSLVILVLARRLASRRTLVAGLVVFGVASIGCGAADSLSALIPLRVVQGIGGALILSASLPLFTRTGGEGDSPLHAWSAAAAVGAAIGPAAGGILTQIFDWRSIFFAQAPVAALAAVAVVLSTAGSAAEPVPELDQPPAEPQPPRSRPRLGPLGANAALTFLSAGLIGALFLVVIELINAWLVSPIGAAAVVTTIPLATVAAEWLTRGRSPAILGALGAILVAGGLVLLGSLSHRELALAVVALALCGAGLGLAFPGLTAAALAPRGPFAAWRGSGKGASASPTARAAVTIAARDAGLVLGLLVLTPVFVSQLNAAQSAATFELGGEVFLAPISAPTRAHLISGLEAAAAAAPESELPNFKPVFSALEAASPADRAQLAQLEASAQGIIDRQVTHAFARPYRYGAILAIVVLPMLALGLALTRRRRVAGAPTG